MSARRGPSPSIHPRPAAPAGAGRPSRRHLLRGGAGVGLVALAAGLTGCRGFPFGAPPALYTLSPKSTFPPGIPTVDWQLLVETPASQAGLDTVRVAITNRPLSLDYFADVAWVERAPAMVQTLILESFENSGSILSIGRETSGLRADYILKTELREFQVETYETPRPHVLVRLNAKLVRIPGRVIIGSENFDAYQEVPSDPFDSVVRTFDDCLGKVLKDLVEWTLVVGQQNWIAQAPREAARPNALPLSR